MIDALHHFHGDRYHLGSYAIAGNHVHVLVSPHIGVELSSVIHSWKSFTSNAINKALGRSGRLWMDEYFDRLLRNQTHLERVEEYIAAHVRQGAYVERRPS
jgi:REP element-mobilizing transposase RayT